MLLALWDMLANPWMIVGPVALVVIAYRRYSVRPVKRLDADPRPFGVGGSVAVLAAFMLGGAAGALALLTASAVVVPFLWFPGTETHAAQAWYRVLVSSVGGVGAAIGGTVSAIVACRWWRTRDPQVRQAVGMKKGALLLAAALWFIAILCSSLIVTPETMIRRMERGIERRAARSGELEAYRAIRKKEALAGSNPEAGITSRDPYTRYMSAIKLSADRDPRALPVLVEAVHEPTAGVPQTGPVARDVTESARVNTIESLARYGDRVAQDALLGVLTAEAPYAAGDDRRKVVALAAIRAIGNVAGPTASPVLLQVVRRAGVSAAAPVSQAAAEALVKVAGRTSDKGALASLNELAHLPGGPDLIQWASSTLPEARTAVLAPLMREFRTVSFTSPVTARAQGDVETLRLLMSRGKGAERLEAAISLMQIADDRVVPALISELLGPDAAAVGPAVRVLGAIGDRRAVGPIRKAIRMGRASDDGKRALWQLLSLRPEELPAGFVPGPPPFPGSNTMSEDPGWCRCIVYHGVSVGVLLDRRDRGRLAPACVALVRGRGGRLTGSGWVQGPGYLESTMGRLDYGVGAGGPEMHPSIVLLSVSRQRGVLQTESIEVTGARGSAAAGRIILFDFSAPGRGQATRVKVDPGFAAPAADWLGRGNTLARDMVAELARRVPVVRAFIAARATRSTPVGTLHPYPPSSTHRRR